MKRDDAGGPGLVGAVEWPWPRCQSTSVKKEGHPALADRARRHVAGSYPAHPAITVAADAPTVKRVAPSSRPL